MNNNITKLHVSPKNEITFSGKFRDAIFGDKMIHYPNSGGHADYDPIQEYAINSSGYRGPDLTKNVDLLFAGCSFTYGMGVPENGIWGSIIANTNNLTYNNISQNGASIPWIVRQLFAYFKEYGNPKTLICLFPNPTRSFFSSNSEILISDEGFVENSTEDIFRKKSVYNTELSHIPNPIDRPKYAKKPYNLEDVISLEFIVQIAMQNIRMLEQYCRSSNIEFFWGSWSEAFCEVFEEQGLLEMYDLSHYVKTGHSLWNNRFGPMSPDIFYKSTEDKRLCSTDHKQDKCQCHISCHQEYLDKYPDAFYRGTDTLAGHPHFGVHKHIHFAESFMARMANK